MKTIYIPVKNKISLDNLNHLKLDFPNLPKNLALAYSIQFQPLALKIKEILEKQYNILLFTQVLGCSIPNFPKKTQAILLISSGRFHAISLAYTSNLPTYIFEGDTFSLISQKEIETLLRNNKAAYLQFLNSSKIGIIISTKPGQENLAKSLSLKKEIETKYKTLKKSYAFLTNNINPREFENFNLDSWVNSACPRMDFNVPILNIRELKALLNPTSLT